MDATYTQGLYIDGDYFNIPMISVKRNFDFLEKYAQRTEDGDMKLETIGNYKNYTISIGTIDDADTYDNLIDKLTDCENRFHKVVMPDTQQTFTFEGYFSSISDEIEKVFDSGARFQNLSWKMTSKKPWKKP